MKQLLIAILVLSCTFAWAEEPKWELEGRAAFSHYGELDEQGFPKYTGGSFNFSWTQGQTRPLHVKFWHTQTGSFLAILWSPQHDSYLFRDQSLVKEYGKNAWGVPNGGIQTLLSRIGVSLSLDEISEILEKNKKGKYKAWNIEHDDKGDKLLIAITQDEYRQDNTSKVKILASKQDLAAIQGMN